MEYKGNILKLSSELKTPIQYYFVIGDTKFNLNSIIGKIIKIEFINVALI